MTLLTMQKVWIKNSAKETA